MINACLFGVGRMGQDHAEVVAELPYARLYCVVDPNEEVCQAVAERFGAKAYLTKEEALADPQVDAILIASRTDTHAELIEAGARAGKPVFCEKPIDMDLDRIDRCLKVVEDAGVPLLVGFNRRFDHSFRKFQENLAKGAVGRLEMVSITSKDSHLPDKKFLRESGGLFRDMMIHDFDIARWLLQEEPCEVYAAGSCLIDPSIAEFGDLDTAMVTLQTESGKLCQISNSRRSVYGYDQRLEAFGEKGMLRAKNRRPSTVQLVNEQGALKEPYYPSFPERYREAYRAELEHFFMEVVPGKQAPLVTGWDGRQALLLADAATASYQSGRPVKLSELFASTV